MHSWGAGRHVKFLQQANHAIKLERAIKSHQIDIHAVDINTSSIQEDTLRIFNMFPLSITQFPFSSFHPSPFDHHPSVFQWTVAVVVVSNVSVALSYALWPGSIVATAVTDTTLKGEVKGWKFIDDLNSQGMQCSHLRWNYLGRF